MTRKPERKALGRGLSALLGDAAVSGGTSGTAAAPAAQRDGAVTIPVDLIHANPQQPRKTFRDEELAELADSISRHGVIQPVVLRHDPSRSGHYQIVAGERRWRAAQRAGIHELPAVIRQLDDREILEIAIIENIQRIDLDPIEEAQGYAQLVDSFGYTQAELAEVIGKSRSHLANTMRLLSLPEQVLSLVREGKLSAGHARALIGAPDPVGLASQAVAKGLNVRQVEAAAKRVPEARNVRRNPSPTKDADTRMLEGDLGAAIGMRVQIEHGRHGGGEIRIHYKTLDDLDRFCAKLAE